MWYERLYPLVELSLKNLGPDQHLEHVSLGSTLELSLSILQLWRVM